jgi:hypothetical protein
MISRRARMLGGASRLRKQQNASATRSYERSPNFDIERKPIHDRLPMKTVAAGMSTKRPAFTWPNADRQTPTPWRPGRHLQNQGILS